MSLARLHAAAAAAAAAAAVTVSATREKAFAAASAGAGVHAGAARTPAAPRPVASASRPPAPPRGTHARTWRALPGVRLATIARPRARVAALSRRNALLARKLSSLQSEIAAVVARLRAAAASRAAGSAGREPAAADAVTAAQRKQFEIQTLFHIRQIHQLKQIQQMHAEQQRQRTSSMRAQPQQLLQTRPEHRVWAQECTSRRAQQYPDAGNSARAGCGDSVKNVSPSACSTQQQQVPSTVLAMSCTRMLPSREERSDGHSRSAILSPQSVP